MPLYDAESLVMHFLSQDKRNICQDNRDVETAVTKHLIAKDTDFYEQGMLKSVPRRGKSLSYGGNYEGISWTGQWYIYKYIHIVNIFSSRPWYSSIYNKYSTHNMWVY
jgi:ABC-type antimicrobial peptide transport system ATPase subunit